jgi:superfamily II DNA/RNA helicase
VLDEADRMLDMGFYDSIAEIIAQTAEPPADTAVLRHLPGRRQATGGIVHA